MPWVNIFKHEACDVVVRLSGGANDYPPHPLDVFPIDANPDTFPIFDSESGCGLYDREDGPVIGIPTNAMYAFSWGMYIIPSGGIAGRRFRARMVEQTSALIDPQPDEGLIQCPGYFVYGCGWEAAFDEASLVPYNPNGNPPADSEWYEFEVVADEPDAGGLESTGWAGLFNYDAQGNTATTRGFYEWQVWVDGPEPSTARPWWLCVRPNPPEPCPVRINPAEEFVHFEDYDVDFKFPLASSRKPMKIKRPTDCIVCAPTLIDEVPPEPPPPALCVELHHQSGSGNNYLIHDYEINGLPDWFVWGNDFEIVYGDYGSGFFVYNSEYNRYENYSSSIIYGPLEGTDGTLLQLDPNNDGGVLTACVNWSIPVGY